MKFIKVVFIYIKEAVYFLHRFASNKYYTANKKVWPNNKAILKSKIKLFILLGSNCFKWRKPSGFGSWIEATY